MRDITEKILVGDILVSKFSLIEGKTKILEHTRDENIVRIVTKDFLTGGDAAKKEEINHHLSPQLQQLLNQFGYDPLPVDIICQQMSLPYAEVATLLMELSLLGYVVEAERGFERIR